MEQHGVRIDSGLCIGCGKCRNVCVAHNITLEQNRAKTVLKDCILCGHCAAVCPKKAISPSGNNGPTEQERELRLPPEDVLNVIRFRRTIRHFQNREIPKQVLLEILEAGRLTHTAKNLQDVSFVVLDRQKDAIEQMAVRLFRKIKPLANLFMPMAKNNDIDDRFFFFGAPIAVVILAKDKTNGILAAQNMEFVAEAHGLGVLFSGFFTMAANASGKLKKALAVPREKRVAMTLVLGYPDVKFLRAPFRKKLDVRYL